MTSLTLQERRQISQLLADRLKRSAVSRILHSPILRWRYGAPVADELLLVPQELRTGDGSFAREIEMGMFGLGGTVASLGDGSVFDITPPSEAWAQDLHGFGWLRHLSAVQSAAAEQFAQKAVAEWIGRYPSRAGAAWAGAVAGRRVLSWLANTQLLLKDADPAFYDRLADSLGAHLIHLSAHWREAAGGLNRLTALIGLMMGTLCVAGHDRLGDRVAADLANEIKRQLNTDGGHKSRNPAAVVELLLDLLPLRTCFQARERAMPESVEAAIPRMLRFVQYMRLGDGSLGRFHGAGAPPFDALATLAAYVSDDSQPLNVALETGYARLSRGGAVVLFDGQGPPPLDFGATATASCLSFEFSVANLPVIVNGGAPGPADQDWLAQSRATASHNTLVLGAVSSSKIVRHKTLEWLVGGAPIRMPEDVSFAATGDNDALLVAGQHDGYRQRFGLLHKRRVRLAKTGAWLAGQDQISSAGRQMRLPRDIPFSVHFHLHPDVRCLPEASPVKLEIELVDGQIWEFTASDATLSVEDSIYYADHIGPSRSHQIVLRGNCFGDRSISWRLQRVG